MSTVIMLITTHMIGPAIAAAASLSNFFVIISCKWKDKP
jgi:hypothetical protein